MRLVAACLYTGVVQIPALYTGVVQIPALYTGVVQIPAGQIPAIPSRMVHMLGPPEIAAVHTLVNVPVVILLR
jgi:hypothetical protein